MELSLVILAAGMGSRYGGLKQLDGLGTHGETIIDYSVYDAIKAGFTKIVFVIREDMRSAFETKISHKFDQLIKLAYVYQKVEIESSLELAPRTKPWGTAHALMAAEDVVKEAFAVINADDYYGRESLELMADFLKNRLDVSHYAMISFLLKNTLSDHGAVSRGICTITEDRFLKQIVERTKIKRQGQQLVYEEEHQQYPLEEDQQISMNLWGFHPSIFPYLRVQFEQFLEKNANNPKAEFYIPLAVNQLLSAQKIKLSVIPSTAKWLGLTYAADREAVRLAFEQLKKEGVHPEWLWD